MREINMNASLKTAVLTAFVILSTTLALAQADRLQVERDQPGRVTVKLDKVNVQANQLQPNFAWAGKSVEIRVVDLGNADGRRSRSAQRRGWGEQLSWLRPNLSTVLTGLRALPSSSLDEIEGESGERQRLRGNPDVNQATVSQTGTIVAAEYILRVTVQRTSSANDLEISLSRLSLFRGIRLELDFSETNANVFLIAEVIKRDTMQSIATYQVVGKAKFQNDVFGQVATGLLRSQGIRVQQQQSDGGNLEMRAVQNAMVQLLGVFQSKDTSARTISKN